MNELAYKKRSELLAQLISSDLSDKVKLVKFKSELSCHLSSVRKDKKSLKTLEAIFSEIPNEFDEKKYRESHARYSDEILWQNKLIALIKSSIKKLGAN